MAPSPGKSFPSWCILQTLPELYTLEGLAPGGFLQGIYGYAANGSVDPYSSVARSFTAGEGSLINTWPSRGRLPLLFPGRQIQ
jgi:hypothetical protein